MPIALNDRVKTTHILLHEDGMPYITKYGTVTYADPDGSWSLIQVSWDDGTKTSGFNRDTVVSVDSQFPYPEPLAYMNPIHPSGLKPKEEWSDTYAAYREKVTELEAELARNPW